MIQIVCSEVGTRESRSQKNLLAKDGENSLLKTRNQKLLEQIRKLKIGERVNLDMKHTKKVETGDVSHIKNHDQIYLCKSRNLKMIINHWRTN